jgi:hypothetical protein
MVYLGNNFNASEGLDKETLFHLFCLFWQLTYYNALLIKLIMKDSSLSPSVLTLAMISQLFNMRMILF